MGQICSDLFEWAGDEEQLYIHALQEPWLDELVESHATEKLVSYFDRTLVPGQIVTEERLVKPVNILTTDSTKIVLAELIKKISRKPENWKMLVPAYGSLLFIHIDIFESGPKILPQAIQDEITYWEERIPKANTSLPVTNSPVYIAGKVTGSGDDATDFLQLATKKAIFPHLSDATIQHTDAEIPPPRPTVLVYTFNSSEAMTMDVADIISLLKDRFEIHMEEHLMTEPLFWDLGHTEGLYAQILSPTELVNVANLQVSSSVTTPAVREMATRNVLRAMILKRWLSLNLEQNFTISLAEEKKETSIKGATKEEGGSEPSSTTEEEKGSEEEEFFEALDEATEIEDEFFDAQEITEENVLAKLQAKKIAPRASTAEIVNELKKRFEAKQ